MSPKNEQTEIKPPLDKDLVARLIRSRSPQVGLDRILGDTSADLYTARDRIRDWRQMHSGFQTPLTLANLAQVTFARITPNRVPPLQLPGPSGDWLQTVRQELGRASVSLIGATITSFVRLFTFLAWITYLDTALRSHQVGDLAVALLLSLGFASMFVWPLVPGFSGISRKWRFSDSRLRETARKVLATSRVRSRLYRFSVFGSGLVDALYGRFGRQSDVYFLRLLGEKTDVPRDELPTTLGQLMQSIYLFLQDQELSGSGLGKESTMNKFVRGFEAALEGSLSSDAQPLRKFLTEWFDQVPRSYREEAAQYRHGALSVLDRHVGGLTTIIASILPTVITLVLGILPKLGS